jgi:hypothetical protein
VAVAVKVGITGGDAPVDARSLPDDLGQLGRHSPSRRCSDGCSTTMADARTDRFDHILRPTTTVTSDPLLEDRR